MKKIDDKWNDSLSVGIEDIDDDHKRLLSFYIRMVELLQGEANTEEFVNILTEMTNYALVHFKTEEDYMESISYPKLKEHKEIHEEYRLKVALFNANYFNVNSTSPREVLMFLKNWWLNHIKTHDTEYAKFAKKE